MFLYLKTIDVFFPDHVTDEWLIATLAEPPSGPEKLVSVQANAGEADQKS
jgi:hypothetical protein